MAKPVTLNLRVAPETKAALQALADAERRTLTAQVEHLIETAHRALKAKGARRG